MLNIGLLGLGAIGSDVLNMVREEFSNQIQIPAVLVKRPRKEKLMGHSLITNDFEEFFSKEQDIVLEVAGHSTVRHYGERILKSGVDLMVTSVGAFTDDTLYKRCIKAATTSGSRLIIPSAGIGSLDTLSAAAVGGLDSVHMIVRKDPTAWYGTHAENLFDLAALKKPTIIFEGSPREGAALYPQNVNISAAVSLAGMGLDKTRLTIIADTEIDTHVCEIHANGAFGSYTFREDLTVAETNRKTGKIVAMAVMKTIRQMVSPVLIGV
ncbi:MAG: aspartate dehydrogenase [Rhodospirillaceae bacterium]|nr:aspartate dehydrogenase [Rhodospirillaceae bacterium]|tara:strand:- start:2239 stop:3039 length:801 start_codon:yes stop_codon:yes gene_type:complete